MMRKSIIAAVAGTLLLVTGCAGESSTTSQGARPVFGNEDVLYRTGESNGAREDTPSAVAASAAFVVEGVVDGFEDGHSETVVNEIGNTETDRFVVIRVKVTSVLKGAPQSFEGGFAYATRPRGVQTFDAAGVLIEGRDLAVPVEEIAAEIPPGTRVVLMASPRAGAGGKAIDPRAGVPEATAPILDVTSPQAILVDGGPDSTLYGWQQDPDLTFASAREEIRDAL